MPNINSDNSDKKPARSGFATGDAGGENKEKKKIASISAVEDAKNNKKKGLDFSKILSRYYKMITLVLVTSVFVLGYYLLVPKYQEISLGGEYSLDTLEQEKSSRQNYLKDLKKIIENYNQISQEDIDKLKQILPEQKDIPNLFIQLQALVEDNGFILSSVDISEGNAGVAKGNNSNGAVIQRLNINLDLVGRDYIALKEFLQSLEYNLRLYDVNAVYFVPGSDTYSINLFTYYFVSK